MRQPEIISNLIDLFAHLPGIGPKTAERFVYFLLKQPKQFSHQLASGISTLAQAITQCEICHSISQTTPCLICVDPKRDNSKLCVVSETHDVYSIDSTGLYNGLYHVLNGALDPLHGITPQQLTIDHLVEKLQKNKNIQEVILGLSPDMEGETTILYLKKILTPLGIKLTRLATGLPTGSDLEYADSITLSKALNNRTQA